MSYWIIPYHPECLFISMEMESVLELEELGFVDSVSNCLVQLCNIMKSHNY